MPSCDLCNFLLTHRAESVLLFPEMEQPLFPFQGVRYVNVKTFFIVALPCWIIRIGLCFDLSVSLDRGVGCLRQVDLLTMYFSVEDPIVSSARLEVFLRDPCVGLLWVSSSHPLSQSSIDRVVYITKHLCADNVLMVLCPSSNDGVEHQDQPAGRERLVLFNDGPDLL